jgi:hypothetical protein
VPTPSRTPLESFAIIRRCLIEAVAAQTGWGLALPLIALIVGKITAIGRRFANLAGRIGAGSYVPRRPPATPRKAAADRPRRPNPLPQTFAWLLRLVPGAAGFGGQLETLFRQPEMAALLAAAPEPTGRALRPLCWMLGVAPPPLLARQRPAPADPLPAAPQPDRSARPTAPAPRPPPSRAMPRFGDAASPPGRPRLRGPPLPA